MFSCYLKMERRQTSKKDGTESITPRFVVTAIAGYFKPLEALKNAKNEIVMYYQRNDKCNKKSTAETRLQCKDSINFSSVYFKNMKIGGQLIGYGEPPQANVLKGGKQNPFYENKEDGYLFIFNPDYTTIDILIVPNGRWIIQGIVKQLADGQLNDVLELMRRTAKPL